MGEILKNLALIGICAGFMAFAATVSAEIITLQDVTTFTKSGTTHSEDLVTFGRGDVNRLDGIFDYVSWEHHYTFTPPADYIVAADLTLFLRDDNDCQLEYGLLFREGSWFTCIGEVDAHEYLFSANISALLDESYRVSLLSTYGDFYIDKSVLTIIYSAATPTAVPEPGSLLLIALSSLCLVGLHVKGKKA